jgi:hypothetical protein
LAEEFEGKVTFVGVSNNDTVPDGEAFVERFKVPYAMSHAPEVWELYDFPFRPTTIIIDAEGKLAGRIDGQTDYDTLKAEIKDVL